MILMTMTPEEVYNQMHHDIYDTLYERISRACIKWNRYLRKRTVSSNQYIAQTLQLQAGNQPYLIVFSWHPYHRRTNELVIYAMVRTDQHMYYVNMPKSTDVDVLDVYTDHFMWRYAERLHLPQRDIPSIFQHFYQHAFCELGIYVDNKENPHDLAFMVPDGLELARVYNHHWLVRRTFVTLDLLKPDQRQAFRTVISVFEEYEQRCSECARQGNYSDLSSVYDYIEDRFESELSEAQELYAQFFED